MHRFTNCVKLSSRDLYNSVMSQLYSDSRASAPGENSGRHFLFVKPQCWISLNPESELHCWVWCQTGTIAPPGPFWHFRCHHLFHFSLLSYGTIYRELERTILGANTQEDLKWFSNNHGPEMHMNWPVFEVQNQTLGPELYKDIFLYGSETNPYSAVICFLSLSLSLSLSLCSLSLSRNTTQTRPVLLQRRRNQTEPHPLPAPTMWLHLVIAAG